MGMIDTHAHLTAKEFDADRDEVIRRAFDAGVTVIVNPGTNLEDSRRAVDLAEKHSGVYAAVGFHPHDARLADDRALAEIEVLSRHPKVVAIGEIGLDFHYNLSPRDVQERVFAAQLEIAGRRDLPIVIHTRESFDRTVTIIEDFSSRTPAWRSRRLFPESRYTVPKGVFHCFPGTVDQAWRVIGQGFCISLPGVLTFKNPGNSAHVAGSISCEHLLLETDSPYLSPVPHRGTRNEPARIPLIADRLADLQHLGTEDIVRATNYTAFRLFGIGKAGEPRFTYPLRNSLYVNLTIRCNADCVFCDRKGEAVIKGNNLKLDREPTVQEVIAEIGDPRRYAEVVFCGYGEPTIRLNAMKEIAAWVKAGGGATRLNTDGHGNVINKRNIVPELVGLIDAVSISLNSTDPVQYGELMRIDGPRFFQAMVDFARECVQRLPKVVMTIVDLDEVDQEKARKFVEEDVGAVFSMRPYF